MVHEAVMKKTISQILGFGERYDPIIGGEMLAAHVARYQFASKFLHRSDTVLDIACGTGYGVEMISGVCQQVIGVDNSPPAIDYAKKNHQKTNTQFLLGDFFSADLAADVVLSFETVEHVKGETFSQVLLKLSSLAKRKIIGSVPYNEKVGYSYHVWALLKEENFRVLENFGKLFFFYQKPDGKIFKKKPSGYIQNLIFVLEKA